MLVSKWLLAAVLFAAAAFGACFARLAQRQGNILKLAEAFAAGSLLNAALVHLLADASRDLDGRRLTSRAGFSRSLQDEEEEEDGYPVAALLCGLGSLLTHLVECATEAILESRRRTNGDNDHDVGHRTVVGKSQSDDLTHVDSETRGIVVEDRSPVSPPGFAQVGSEAPNCKDSTQSLAAGPLLMMALSLHSLLEGLSLGAAKEGQVLHLFMAILAHKGVAAFALGVAWLPGLPCLLHYALAMAWFAAVTPIGIFIGTSAEGSTAGAILTALSAGTFLYIGLVETCPGVRSQLLPGRGALGQGFACLAGFTAMGILGLWT